MKNDKCRIGIDLGGTHIAGAVLTPDGRMMGKKSIPTDAGAGDVKIVNDIIDLVFNIISSVKLKESDIASVGIGCPGVSDSEKGILVKTVNLPFSNTDIRKIFSERTSIPVYLGNDANCAALGEMAYGGAKGYKNSITITLGTGVGGGIIIDGKIYAGFNFAGAELGHMVIRSGGYKCSCGRRGCLEAYASATAVIRETKKVMARHPESLITSLCNGDPDNINGKTAFDAARAGDKWGKKIVRDYVKNLGEGIVNFVNIFQPEIVLVGGGISKEGEFLLGPLREYVSSFDFCKGITTSARIERTLLGNDAGIIGAALLNEQYEKH